MISAFVALFKKPSNDALFTALDKHASLQEIQSIVKANPKAVRKKMQEIQTSDPAPPWGVRNKHGRGWLPLHFACAKGASLEIIQYLVEQYPASIKVKNDPLMEGLSAGYLPLHVSCEVNSFEVARFLVETYPKALRVKTDHDDLPLHLACRNFRGGASFPLIRYLVEQYPDSVKAKGRAGQLPLHKAIFWNIPFEVMQFLVEQYPASIQTKCKEGLLPLHLACIYAKFYEHPAALIIIQYLVEKYPESMYDRDNISEKTPLDVALRNHNANEEIVNWLKSYVPNRWFRAGKLILLRALVDQGRARLVDKRHSLIAGKKGTFGTNSELDLMDFLFCTSPEGIFASIMLYL